MKTIIWTLALAFLAQISLLAEREAKGLILYAEPPSTFVEICEFTGIRPGPLYSTISRADKGALQIDPNGVIAELDYPKLDHPAEIIVAADENIKLAQSLAAKYPQYKIQLNAVVSKWQNAIAFAKQAKNLLPPPQAKGISEVALLQVDGTKYEHVVIRRRIAKFTTTRTLAPTESESNLSTKSRAPEIKSTV